MGFWHQSIGYNNKWQVMFHELARGKHWVILELHNFKICDGSCCRPEKFYVDGKPLEHIGLKLPKDRGWNSWRQLHIRAFGYALMLRWTGPIFGML